METIIDISLETIKGSITITALVMLMMIIIEYVNVQSSGKWFIPLKNKAWLQIILAGALGLIPGCLGAFLIVSLYTHNIMCFAALVTAMISTFGDEAFIMFAMMPGVTIKLAVIIFLIAIVSGFLVHIFIKRKNFQVKEDYSFPIHEKEDRGHFFNMGMIKEQLKHITLPRFILLAGTILLVFGLFTGEISHEHGGAPSPEEGVIKIIFLVCSAISLFIFVTVPDHFIQEHLWEHIIKNHLFRIFLWTLGALLVVHIGLAYIPLKEFVQTNQLMILVIAVLIGIIPESGPHLIFVTMFFEGTIPFSILLANSIVQDGHGGLPLFAESKKSFIFVKLINTGIGLIVGIAGLLAGW